MLNECIYCKKIRSATVCTRHERAGTPSTMFSVYGNVAETPDSPLHLLIHMTVIATRCYLGFCLEALNLDVGLALSIWLAIECLSHEVVSCCIFSITVFLKACNNKATTLISYVVQ